MSAMTRLTLAGVAATLLAGAPAKAAESPIGIWLDDSGRGAVEIVECGAGTLCGKLVWLQDGKNSKACGTPIIGGVKQIGESWDGGWIYSPEKKSKYDVELTARGDQLTVLGYAGTKMFSKEMTWTRAPANLVRCDQQQAKAPAPPAPTATATARTAPVETATTAPAAPPKTAAQNKADAEAWANEPGRDGTPAAGTETAQADVPNDEPPTAAAPPAPVKRAKAPARKKEMCRVEAPFVTVDFPCDDD